ncbi:MAG: TonB-dependent receptor [Bryobacteraceae bacterium]
MEQKGVVEAILIGVCAAALGFGQSGGTIKGRVTLATGRTPVHGASVLVGQAGRKAQTDSDGVYEIQNVPAGTYTITVHLHSLTDEAKSITVEAGKTLNVDFSLKLRAIKQEITVTASGQEQSAFEAFQTVTTVDSLDLAAKSQTSLGEVLDNTPGVAKRSFGVGNSRPVIRGFDGDRVLVLNDGISTGTLSSQSGDHGESIDPSSIERLEVLKGPATLLYGSNALGGVVNAVTGHHQTHQHSHPGLRAYLTGIGGSANGHGGGSGGFEFGVKDWLFWGGGGGQRTGDYSTPIGKIENSHTRLSNTFAGAGWYGRKSFFDTSYRYEEGRFGVPFAGEFEAGHADEADSGGAGHSLIDLDFRRHNVRVVGGFNHLGGFLDSFRMTVNYSDYQHRELEGEEVGTQFNNKQVIYRGMFDQQRYGRLSGSFGFQGVHRDYISAGAEALAPPVKQNGFAVFGLEEVTFEKFRIQLGGRVENNQFNPDGLQSRSFTGFSGAAGIYVPLWKHGAFVTNVTHSYRAPALEELYNHGPHVGNLTFEIGNVDLNRERSNGVDVSLRHQGARVRAEWNYFYYNIDNFVYLAPTGRIEDGLVEADWAQANSRFTGTEANLDVGLHPNVWLNLGTDYVNAQLKQNDRPLPRIPPLRGRAGVDFRFKGFSVKPELVMANRQARLFDTEKPTAGYAVFNLGGSYTITRQHEVHQFSASFFNMGDRLYRNHLSFIKELAPEIGRGVRFTYTLRFF